MDWIFLIIGLVGGFVLSIIANLCSDKLKDWYSKRTFITRNKRVNQLKHELQRLTEYHDNINYFYLHLANNLFSSLVRLFIFCLSLILLFFLQSAYHFDILFSSVLNGRVTPEIYYAVFQIVLILFIVFILLLTFRDVDRTLIEINFLLNFSKNKIQMEKRIEKISGNSNFTLKSP